MIDAGIEPNEAKCELKMLLEHFCGYTDKDKIMGKELTESQYNLINAKVSERIATRTPVQYIIGRAWFMGNYYKVTPNVLIPRDETELLVKKAIEIIQKNDLKKVLDIGTGSGCIACTIAKCTDAEVLGTDISSDALRVALDNVTLLGINNRAVFRKSDLFEKIHPDEKFDMIISNPPYIPFGTELPEEVRHEPKTALFADDSGLEFYKKISENAHKYLNKGGFLLFELGINENEQVHAFMRKYYKEIETIKDFAGIERVITGKFKE